MLTGRGILALAGLCGVTRRSRDCLSPGALETCALIGRLGDCCSRWVYVRRPVSGVDAFCKIVFVELQALLFESSLLSFPSDSFPLLERGRLEALQYMCFQCADDQQPSCCFKRNRSRSISIPSRGILELGREWQACCSRARAVIGRRGPVTRLSSPTDCLSLRLLFSSCAPVGRLLSVAEKKG